MEPAERYKRMSSVKSKGSKPEMIVRRMIHALGYRYRLHVKELPGSPDLVFRGKKKAVFIHGCFWHRHDCKSGSRIPPSNKEYWLPKLALNQERDRKVVDSLLKLGWSVLVIWECETKDADSLRKRITTFLESEFPAACER
jgi:DNA mismatch endonuclease (patch repair protein)